MTMTDVRYIRIPMIRADIVNMTRLVHHHYDYAKDGHKRTYEMHVEVNQTVTRRVHQYFHYYNKNTSAIGIFSYAFDFNQ